MLNNDINNEETGAIPLGTQKQNNVDAALSDENEESNGSPAKMELYDWLQCIVSAVICGIFIFVFIGRVIGVELTSMLPTLCNNDRVIMSNLFYTPDNGDIVIFKTDYFGDTPLVKRVIATAGQELDINFDTGEVKVDGVVLDEPYINTPTNSRQDFHGPVIVPEGHIFVMGDNRNASTDSRSANVGMVDTRSILGKVLLVVMPGKNAAGVREWSRLGSVYS